MRLKEGPTYLIIPLSVINGTHAYYYTNLRRDYGLLIYAQVWKTLCLAPIKSRRPLKFPPGYHPDRTICEAILLKYILIVDSFACIIPEDYSQLLQSTPPMDPVNRTHSCVFPPMRLVTSNPSLTSEVGQASLQM